MSFGISLPVYTITVLVAPVLYIIFKITPFLLRTWRKSKALKQFPMDEYHWLLGHLADHHGPTHEGFMQHNEWVAKYPRYFGFYFGPLRPVLVVTHPDVVKIFLKSTEPKAISAGGPYSLVMPWIGDGLLISSGKKWFRNRKLLTPGFHFDILKGYMNVYNECVSKLLHNFEKHSLEPGKSTDVFKLVQLCTLDVILRCAFSMEKDVQSKGATEPYVENVNSLASLIFHRAMRPYLYFDSIYYKTPKGEQFRKCCEFSHNFSKSVIRDHKEKIKNKDVSDKRSKHFNFLDILLCARDEFGDGLSDTEILDEVETFMFGGHDTAASAISWILYNLARHSEIQSKAREEVDNLLSSRETDCINWEDLNALPYLTMCIKESLRLHPPVPDICRETTKPFEIDGKTLATGTFIDILIWSVHHNPTIWEDPLTYDPDRFSPGKLKEMNPYAFIPFSAGPRNCIGQNFVMHEIKVAIARTLCRFELELDNSIEVRVKPELVLRAENGIHIYFKRRNFRK